MKKLLLILLATAWTSPAFADNFCYHLYDMDNGRLISSHKEPPHELTLPQTNTILNKDGVQVHLVITIDDGDCDSSNTNYSESLDS